MKPAFFITVVAVIAIIFFVSYKAAILPHTVGMAADSSFALAGASSTAVSTSTATSAKPLPPKPKAPISAPPTPTSTPASTTPAAEPSSPAGVGSDVVCNTSLIGSDGYDAHHMIDLATCKKLNSLYAAGKAAGNKGDLYDNRDGLHVNLCVDWTPNPECPSDHRLFPQHDWKFSGAVGRATSPQPVPTLGQASWSGANDGSIKHSIPYDMYGSQAGAETLYDLYTHNNLYVYPSLYDDSFTGSASDPSVLADPSRIDPTTANRANTPYVIASKQICDCGAGALRVHDASGSDLPFIELGMAGLAAFQPSVKQALIARGMLMPTLQALIRYSHRSVGSDEGYLSSIAHQSALMAHYLRDGAIRPAYDAGELVDRANSMTLADVPPVVRLDIVSETFSGAETLFTTPGSIARSVAYGSSTRSITVSAAGSHDVSGSTADLEYVWRVISGDSSLARIAVDPAHNARATIEFSPSSSTGRIDVGVFVRKRGGAYYSVPGIVSEYVHP